MYSPASPIVVPNEAQRAISQIVEERAKALLYMCLTEEQRTMLETQNKFRVVSNKGNIFEIRRGRMHNIFRLDMQGNIIEEWCVLPPGNLPIYDVLLAQKVSLESDEDDTYARANVWAKPSHRIVHTAPVQYRSGDDLYRAVA
jgi:hypothetical protein